MSLWRPAVASSFYLPRQRDLRWPGAPAEKGIAAFVLKYRVEPSPEDLREAEHIFSQRLKYLSDPAKRFSVVTPAEQSAIADGAAAVRKLRERASSLQIHPDSIGFLGFAAGGLIAGGLASAQTDARPNFLGVIYAFFRGQVPKTAPPAFIAAATDDKLLEDRPIQMFQAWREAGRPAELHLYESGGHDFANKSSGLTSQYWLDAFVWWMKCQNIEHSACEK